MIVKKPEDQYINILTASYCQIGDLLQATGSPEIELDLGCGKGSFSTLLAHRYPERTIASADVMIGRLRKLAKRNVRENVTNGCILRVEARHLIGYMLPDGIVNRLHILCPDPWPKEKHKAQRLMSSDFLGRIHRVLADDGVFHFASDDKLYFDIVNEQLALADVYDRDDSRIDDIRDLKTDFEKRWIEEGKTVHHCAWVKR